MRLIDADALLEQMKKLYQKRSEESNMTGDRSVCVTWNDAVFCINDSPTIDAVPVVRCADCKWLQCNMRPDGHLPNGVDEYECRHWCGGCDPTDFCSYGERKDGADNG